MGRNFDKGRAAESVYIGCAPVRLVYDGTVITHNVNYIMDSIDLGELSPRAHIEIYPSWRHINNAISKKMKLCFGSTAIYDKGRTTSVTENPKYDFWLQNSLQQQVTPYSPANGFATGNATDMTFYNIDMTQPENRILNFVGLFSNSGGTPNEGDWIELVGWTVKVLEA